MNPSVPQVAEDTLAASVLARLRPKIASDPVLKNQLDSGWMRAGDRIVRPSGLDLLACALSKTTLTTREGKIAIAIPRGRSPMPALLGLYLVLWRLALSSQKGGSVCGSVVVSTNRAELRQLARELVFDGSAMGNAIPVARLVSEPVGERRVRAAALTLDRSSLRGLTQSDSYLLFQLPNRAPPVVFNVITAMVIDTFGASEDSWIRTYEQNDAARRRQIWIGELGNEDFRNFCTERQIPQLDLNWPLIELAASEYGVGGSDLASTPCCNRALERQRIGFRVVRHEAMDEELRELWFRLFEMRRRGRTEEPEPVMYASWLANLLSRLSCPLEDYESAVNNPMVKRVEWLLERVTEAGAPGFRNRWKGAFNSHWTGVKAAAKGAARILADRDDCPKYWALLERVMAREDGELLRIICQTRTEESAVHRALLGSDLFSEEDLGTIVEVSSYSKRHDQGDVGETVNLFLSPPPRRHAALYLSGERGRTEILCYPFEVARLRSRVVGAWRECATSAQTHGTLDQLKFGGTQSSTVFDVPAAEELLIELGEYVPEGPTVPSVEPEIDLPAADAGFWERLPDLYGRDLNTDELASAEDSPDSGTRYSGFARLVSFSDGPSMYFRDDADCTVIVAPPSAGGEPDVVSLRPQDLVAQMRIAVLPGSERGGLLAELMAAWDEGLELVRHRYDGMYRRALDAAIARHGTEDLAKRVGLSEAAVRGWQAERSWPGTAKSLVSLLEASGDAQAIDNQTVIHDYFNRVRGAHRYIGRVLNEAVGETILHHTGAENVRKLERLVGIDLSDLFDSTSILTVERVGEPERIPAAVCGQFLDRTDPYLQATGTL